MSTNVKPWDLTILEDMLVHSHMAALAQALDSMREDFAPNVLVVLTRTDDNSSQKFPIRVFTSVEEFDSWREDFEKVPNTAVMIEHLKDKYKDYNW